MPKKNPDQMPMSFLLPESNWQFPEVLPDLRRHPFIALDLETRDSGIAQGRGSGWVYGAGHICGVAAAVEGEAIYIPLTHPDGPTHDDDAVRRWVQDHIHCGGRIVMHNSPYDLGWLRSQWNIFPPALLDDTQIMAYLLDENRLEYSLDKICKTYGVEGKDEELLEQAAKAYGCDPKADMWRMPAKFVGPYGEQDAVATLEVLQVMRPRLEAQNLTDAYQLECDLIPMVMDMRGNGVRMDVDRAPQVRSQLLQERNMHLDMLTDKIDRVDRLGRQVEFEDVMSPKYLDRLFRAQGIEVVHTEKGNPSFKTDLLEKIDHPIMEHIVAARKCHDAGEKFIGTYIQEFTHLGRIHAEARSTKTRTTRFAYSDPPLQQMPSRNPKIAKLIRGLFLPNEEEIWGALDYSQQEFRLMVHFAFICDRNGAERAVDMYNNDPDTDFHNLASELTELPRRKAKDVNFAKAFGAGKHKFASMTGMTLETAVETMGIYDQKLPFISELSDFCQKRAEKRGFILLLDGARCHFEDWEPSWIDWKKVNVARSINPDIKVNPCSKEEALKRVHDKDHPWSGRIKRAKTHKAMNSLIQGSAARQTKLCMRECYRNGIVPLLQMHDELDFSFGIGSEGEKQAELAAEIMRETVKLEVPVMVDAEFGPNWGSAKAEGEYGATYQEAVSVSSETRM